MIKPLGDWVLIEPSTITESASKIAREGVVVGGKLKKGTKVLVEPFLGVTAYESGKPFLLVKEENVIGVIE